MGDYALYTSDGTLQARKSCSAVLQSERWGAEEYHQHQ